MNNNLRFIHFKELSSTNQKMYQLAVSGAAAWTVIWCDTQSTGKGYGQNIWQSNPYQNCTFSFLLREAFDPEVDLPLLNMWICKCITVFLSKWQINAQVKWPNDIMLNGKKLAGILIENKIQGSKTKFSVVGVGLNLNQTEFIDLPQATSVKLENPKLQISVEEFISGLMNFIFEKFSDFREENFERILKEYNDNLLRRDQICVFERNEIRFNGIIREVNARGNLLIETEGEGLLEFRHKEVQMLF